MIGVLHAYVLLKPTLEKCIKNCSKIDGAIKFLHKNGFGTHSKLSMPNAVAGNKTLPIITRDDALYFLSLDYQSATISSQMSNLFDGIEEALNSLGQNMPPIP